MQVQPLPDAQLASLQTQTSTPNQNLPQRAESVIDAYPDPIKEAVLRAFNKPEEVIRERADAAQRKNAAKRLAEPPQRSAPIRVVQPETPRIAESQPSEPPVDDDEEARRRERRKAFLDAIRRSRDEELTDEEREERAARRERLLEALRRHRAFREAE